MYRLNCRLLLLVLIALGFAPCATAQMNATLTWDQFQEWTVTGFRVGVDGSWQDYGASPFGEGGVCSCAVDLSLSAGPHTIIVSAYNEGGETLSPQLTYTTPGTPPPAPPSGLLPAPWTNQDIGDAGVSGSAGYLNGTFVVTGGGDDIWGRTDAFHYVFQPLLDSGEIVAQVTSLPDTDGNAKAGVMLRGGLTASAPHVMLSSAVDGSVELISRSSAGSAATFIAGAWQPRPGWLKLTRAGSTVTGSISSDGQSWSIVGSTNVAGLALAGLAVASGDSSVPNVSTFDAVTVSTGSGPASPAGDIVVYASDVPESAVHGRWQLADGATSPNRIKLTTTSNRVSNSSPLASPGDYVDVSFNAAAGTPYAIWLRISALNNSRSNDSLWVQLSDAEVGGEPAYPIGSTSGLLISLATDWSGSSLNGWGWQNGAYWLSQPATVTFANGGQHTLRVQIREDGVQLDQIVLSPSTYLTEAPGQVSGDLTIVVKP